MPVYWLKYRDDLYKKVTLFNDPTTAIRDPLKQKSNSDIMLSILPKEDECYDGFERLAAQSADGRTRCNIRRAARQIEAYALCNNWDLFFTGTLDAKKRDRSDIDEFKRAITKFMVNQRRSYPDLSYLFVPELHADGKNWHVHGLIYGLPIEALRAFKRSDKPPKYIQDKLKAGFSIYEWESYRNSFGFNDLEPILSRDRAARYITKYITKDVMDASAKSIDKGKSLYIPSRNLRLPELVQKIENVSGCNPETLSNNLVPVVNGRYCWDYGEAEWFVVPQANSSR